MDRKATAATGECHQERGREGLGAQVSGIPTEPRHADRSGTGEFGAIQSEGTGEVAELPESDGETATGQLAAVYTRLVGVLPTGREPPTDLPAGGMDSPPYPEMLLAAVAQTGRERTAGAEAGDGGGAGRTGEEP